MKQIHVSTAPLRTARSAADASNGGTCVNQTKACAALQSAETIVAPACRKKQGVRNELRDFPDEAAGTASAKPGARSAHDDPVIGNCNTDNAGAHADLVRVVSKRLHDRTFRGGSPDKVGEVAVDMRGAVAFDANGKGKRDDDIDGLSEAGPEPRPANPAIPGIDDRIPYMALTTGAANPALRPPKMAPPPLVNPLKPKSRAECQRRCGSDGFCDPSSELGCGGMHCGRKYARG